MHGIIYVTFPYPFSFIDSGIVYDRVIMARKWCREMLLKGFWPVCPMLIHNAISNFEEMPAYKWGDFREYVMPMMNGCEAIQVLMFKGWEESANVQDEIQFAKAHGYVITYVNTEALEEFLRSTRGDSVEAKWGVHLE